MFPVSGDKERDIGMVEQAKRRQKFSNPFDLQVDVVNHDDKDRIVDQSVRTL